MRAIKRVDSEAKEAGRQLVSVPPVVVPVTARSAAMLVAPGEDDTPFDSDVVSVGDVEVGFGGILTINRRNALAMFTTYF